MRIQVASDLHHELATPGSAMALPITPAPGIDVLVLAGDIHKHLAAIDLYADCPMPVVYIHGNHECYGADLHPLVSELWQRAAGTSVRFLEKEEFVLGSVRFVGGCLWTDYLLFPLRFDESLEHARVRMLGHRKIRAGKTKFFRPGDPIAEQQATLAFLAERIRHPFSGTTVVVTHHVPSGRSVFPSGQSNPLSPAFASNLEYLVSEADFWVHGLLASFPS
ncbi:metallophosphoesterase [Paraburkholderia sediminicola]|nr:metallophosphoesterase [Paraburkholderia sediminicola]